MTYSTFKVNFRAPRAQNIKISSFLIKNSTEVSRAGNARDLSILTVGTTRAGVAHICAPLPCTPPCYCTFHSAHASLIVLPQYIGGRGERGKRKRGPFRGQNFCGSPSQVDGHGWPRSRVEGGLTRVPGRRAAKKKKQQEPQQEYL